MNIKIDKRVPFGFKGKWGKCYKLFNFNQTENSINYQQNSYFDIGYDIQFKDLEKGIDKTIVNAQPIANLIAKGDYRVIKTTDAFLDKDNTYKCVCQPNDIILFDNEYWVVERIDARSVYTPQKQVFYYLTIKNIFNEVLTDENSRSEGFGVGDILNEINTTLIRILGD